MVYTKHEVIEYVESGDVKFIRLVFFDLFGVQKNISIMPGELARAFESGIPFDASSIDGFLSEEDSDLLLFPDPTTLSVLPWRPTHGRVVRLFCDIRRPDGSRFEHDCRHILRSAAEAARRANVGINIGTEYEFYLFKTDAEGTSTSEPHDRAGYMDIAPEDKGENIRREICLTLEEMHIIPESSHHEGGPGQHEIDFRYASPLISADNAATFKSVVRTVAQRNGLYASFEPKPIAGAPGSGMHINMSITSQKKDEDTDHFMAGILTHMREMSLFLNPTVQSYERLGEHKAPKFISYATGNRSTLIRIPSERGDKRRFEVRSPDPTANPYLATALLIYAGLEGIEKKLALPAPTEVNLYDPATVARGKLETLPESLAAAAKCAEASSFIAKYLPRSLVSAYVRRLSN